MANFLDGFDNDKYNSNTPDSQKKEQQISKSEQPSSGVKVTEHEVVIDKSYGRKKMIRFGIMCGSVALLCVAGFFIIRVINQVTVQNFVGKTLAEANAWASKNSIEVDAQYEYNKDIYSDTVITQSVDSGEKISKGDTLHFTVSNGADPAEKISIPDFSIMTAAQIQTWIDENKLTNTKISEENSDTIALGGFIKSVYRDVTSDKDNFMRKDYLTLTVSKGPSVPAGDITMSNLVGDTKSEAESWASTNGIVLVTTTQTSQTIATDNVISQDVATGNIVPAGGTVNIIISGGTGIEVPSFLKIAMSDAQDTYSDFSVTIKQQYSSSVGYGKFLSQSVTAGTHVLANDNKVVVTYSIGKPYLENLAGSSEKDLPSYFSAFTQKGATISYSVTYADSDVEKGTIISTSKYNEYLSMSETIEIIVSNGSQTTQGTGNISSSGTTTTNDQTTSTSKSENVVKP